MSDDSNDYALSGLFGEARHELIAHVPHTRFLGIEVVVAEPRAATLRLPYREDLIGDPSRGVIFGGVITTLLDQACGLAVGCSLAELQVIATLDLRIDYLRAASPGLDLIGRAECYKLTKNVAFVRGLAHDGNCDDPFASCLATFMIGANPSQSPFVAMLDQRGSERQEDPS